MRTVFAVLGCVLLVACSLSGGPPPQDVRTAYIQTLPGLLAVEEFALDDARNVGNDTAPVWVARLSAKVALREPTYDIETVVGGVRILKPVRAAGESFSVYGTVRSERTGNGWRHHFERDATSNPVIGRARADYGPDALIAGSAEAESLVAEKTRVAEQARIAEETRIAEEAAERKRKEDAEAAHRARIEAAAAKYHAAFAPDNLRRMANGPENVGKTLHFIVDGLEWSGSGRLIGTDIYSLDSDFAKAVAHAGVLKRGQSGIVAATIVAAPRQYAGSPRNGVDSRSGTIGSTCCYQAYSLRLAERLTDAP